MLHIPYFADAELSALKLQGEVFQDGDFYFPIDVPESSLARADSLASLIVEGFWAERQSALWVYGFGSSPQIHQLATLPTNRSGSFQNAKISHILTDTGDIVQLGNLKITNPYRTLIDCLSRPKDTEPDAVAALARFLRIENNSDLSEPKSRALQKTFRSNLVAINSVNIVNSVDASNRIQYAIQMGGVTHFKNVAANS